MFGSLKMWIDIVYLIRLQLWPVVGNKLILTSVSPSVRSATLSHSLVLNIIAQDVHSHKWHYSFFKWKKKSNYRRFYNSLYFIMLNCLKARAIFFDLSLSQQSIMLILSSVPFKSSYYTYTRTWESIVVFLFTFQ